MGLASVLIAASIGKPFASTRGPGSRSGTFSLQCHYRATWRQGDVAIPFRRWNSHHSHATACMTRQFLIIDDDETFASVLARSISRKGYQAHIANDSVTALALLRDQKPDIAITHVVLDLKLSETTGLQLLPQLLSIQPDLQVVVLTGYASVATTVDAIKQGASNYLSKPATVEEILAAFDSDSNRRKRCQQRPREHRRRPVERAACGMGIHSTATCCKQ